MILCDDERINKTRVIPQVKQSVRTGKIKTIYLSTLAPFHLRYCKLSPFALLPCLAYCQLYSGKDVFIILEFHRQHHRL